MECPLVPADHINACGQGSTTLPTPPLSGSTRSDGTVSPDRTTGHLPSPADLVPRIVDWPDIKAHGREGVPFFDRGILWAEVEIVVYTPMTNICVRDTTGRRLSLTFDAGRHRSCEEMLKRPLPKVGQSVCFQYSAKFPALFETTILRVMPMPLHDLMALGHRVRLHALPRNGSRVCHGCGCTSKSLKCCPCYELFWHCSEVRDSAMSRFQI